jgi:hypothetical protein
MMPVATVASSDDATRLAAHLIQVMDAMLMVLEDETKLVRAGKLSAAAKLAASKQELSHLYYSDVQVLKANQQHLKRTAPHVVEMLRKRHEEFQAVLQMNLTVLATAHAVSEGIMRGVSDELTRKSSPSVYGASGRTAPPSRYQGQPLTVSRTL